MGGWDQQREIDITARCEAATKAPWEFNRFKDWTLRAKSWGIVAKIMRHDACSTLLAEAEGNAKFIAHARTDLPAALKEIEYLGKIYEETQRHSDGVERENQRLREELISAWPHTAFTCPCSDRLAESAPLDKCDCGLKEALYGH